MRPPINGTRAGETQLQSFGRPALMLPFIEGTGENGRPGWQALGLVSHEEELHPPRWMGSWEEWRPRVMAWVAR